MKKVNKSKKYDRRIPELFKTWNNYTYKDSFAVISAFRLNKNENQKQHSKLKKIVRAFGLNFEELKAGNVGSGKKTFIKSLFIPDIKRSDAVKLALHFNQKCILFKDAKGLHEISIHEKSGYSRIIRSFVIADDRVDSDTNLEVLRYYFFSKLFCKKNFAFLRKAILEKRKN